MNRGKLKAQILSGMLWKFAERFVAQGVSFAVSLILARILMPSDYGIVAIINVLISVADVILSSGLNASLIQKKDASELEFSTIFYCNLIFSCVLYLALFCASPWMADIYEMPVLKSAIRIFALRLPISAFQSIQISYVSKRMEFRKFFWATITGTVVSAVVGITMAVLGFGVWALIAQYLTNTLIDTLVLWITVRWHPKRMFSLKSAVPLIRYGWKVMMTDVLGTVCNNLGAFLIGAQYASAQLAFYEKGKQLPQMLRSNIYTTLISVLFPGISSVNDDKEAVKQIAKKSIRMMSYVIFPMMFGLMAVGESLIVVLYTDKWLPMLPFICLVCLETVFSVPGTISLQIIKSIGRSDTMLGAEIVKKLFFFVSILIAMRYGVMAIAFTLPLNTLLDFVINGILTDRLVGYSVWEQIKDCLPAVSGSVIMALGVYVETLWITLESFPMLCLQVITGIAIYWGVSVLAKNESYRYLLSVLRKVRVHKTV